MVLLIVGSRYDQVARDLAMAWAPHAALLTCEDLSSPGWRYYLTDRAGSRAVVAGDIVPESEIHGVVVRRLAVLANELVHIAAADREYAAVEMHAFLFSWLSNLSCPVLNPPSGTSLCGPDWRPLQWIRAARRAGLDTETVRCLVPAPRTREAHTLDPAASPIEVHLVGEQCFGAPDERYAAGAKRLAALAKTPLLTVRFHPHRSAPCFHSASALPDLRSDDIAQAVHAQFAGCRVEA
jgi:hypothetical protein